MTTGKRLLNVALSQVGTGEESNGSNKYGRWYGLDCQPWCQIFVSWCADAAGISPAIIPKLAYCPTALAWFRDRGRLRP